MRRCFTFTMLTFMLVALWNCGGVAKGPNLTPEPTRNTFKGIPDWYNNLPEKEGFLYAARSGTSQDFQMAVDIAVTAASTELARMVEMEANSVSNNAAKQTESGGTSEFFRQFTSTQEVVVSNVLEKTKTKEQEIIEERSKDGDIFRAFVLLEYDSGYQNKLLLDAIKADQLLYEKLQATELLDEMEAKVEAYRKRKGL